MSARRQEVIEQVFAALQNHTPTTALESLILANFEEYVRVPQFPSLPLPFLLNIVTTGRLKIHSDDICKLFVENVPYNGYNSLALLSHVNFHAVSTSTLLQMREIPGSDGEVVLLPIIAELIQVRDSIAKAQECGGARIHDFDENGV
jgi:hypothetical protein